MRSGFSETADETLGPSAAAKNHAAAEVYKQAREPGKTERSCAAINFPAQHARRFAAANQATEVVEHEENAAA